MEEDAFFERLRIDFRYMLGGHVASPVLDQDGVRDFIVPAALGDDAELCGAITLAQTAQQAARRMPNQATASRLKPIP